MADENKDPKTDPKNAEASKKVRMVKVKCLRRVSIPGELIGQKEPMDLGEGKVYELPEPAAKHVLDLRFKGQLSEQTVNGQHQHHVIKVAEQA